MSKRKLEPCRNCGFYGFAEISHVVMWGIFCGPCKVGVVSRFLMIAVWKWNHRWRNMKKTQSKQSKAKQE